MYDIKKISGGVCAAKGFKAGGIHCGIRKNRKKSDLALIVSEKKASAAAVYTLNLVKGAPLTVTKANLADGYAQAVIVNSGNANTCNSNGIEIAEGMCALVEKHTGICASDVVVASTGVIGQKLDLAPIAGGMDALTAALKSDGSCDAAEAIMTTDTKVKEIAFSFTAGGKSCHIGGIAKGSGMIHPNMATMLCFVTTDCAISVPMLQKAIKAAADTTFNMISVDGDTSTNDTLAIMANGEAENEEITEENEAYKTFLEALTAVCRKLSMMMAGDGEGATKLLICKTTGAKDWETAKTVAKSVICSSLLKAAMFGEDANWGRVLCAIGYAGADIDINKVDVSFKSAYGQVDVCVNGAGINFSEEEAAKVLHEKEITILVELNSGDAEAEAFGCDLTYDYVKINGDYRT